jgi:predicted ATPase/DNA-binding SARP family transcriptional activator
VTVEFRLLGHVEAQLDGRRLDIGHARQQCVLVALIVDVNHPVPADQMIDRVWADDLPHRARNALAAYISRLRQVFGGTEVRIVRESGSYVLKTDALSVDIHRFRHITSQARATADPADAANLFDSALGLWRGEPFATLDTPWVNEVRTAVEAERISATLDRNDAALQAGRHADLLGELVMAAQAHPLDERLAAQLMLAQYRSGRQAEALETYRLMRERLIEELGVDPSPTLRSVHQRILDGDTAAPGQKASHPIADRSAVIALPRRATSFVGRTQDLSRLADALHQGPLLTLTGVGGVGKTRLALEVAGRERERFRDGVWLCELAPLDDGAAVGHAMAAALRLQQRQGLDIESTVIEYLATRELLLIVDNCEHLLDPTAGLVDRIIKHCAQVTVLSTSREALGVEGEQIYAVPPLAAEEATALFADRARAGRPDFDLEREPVGAVAEICRQLDGLPLAIELAAARMRVMSSLDVARRLDTLRLLSGGSRGALPRQQSVTATIDWSYRLLAEPERSLFARLSVFAGGFDLDAAHGACGEDGAHQHDTLDLLTGLVDKSMVTMRSDGGETRYGVLETLRAYGRERLCDNGVDGIYARRHAAYFAELAERAAAGMHGPDEQAWVERMLPDYDNLRAAFEHAIGDQDLDVALRLVTSLSEFVHLRIGFEASGWAERTLEVVDPEHPLFAAAVGFAARGAWNRGDQAKARKLASLAHGRLPGRGNGRVAYPGDVLADVALYEGDSAAALAHYEGEMARARRDDDPIRLVWTLFYVAICQAALRTPEAGLAAAEEALQVADGTANPTARSMGRYAVGLVLKKSDPDRALALFDEAAELAASVQNFWWHGIALMEAASTRGVHGDPARAASDFSEVLDHWDRVGDWSQQWLNLRYVTRFLNRVGAEDDAVTIHRALVRAGKQSPLSATQAATLDDVPGGGLSGADLVVRARSALARYL